MVGWKLLSSRTICSTLFAGSAEAVSNIKISTHTPTGTEQGGRATNATATPSHPTSCALCARRKCTLHDRSGRRGLRGLAVGAKIHKIKIERHTHSPGRAGALRGRHRTASGILAASCIGSESLVVSRHRQLTALPTRQSVQRRLHDQIPGARQRERARRPPIEAVLQWKT